MPKRKGNIDGAAIQPIELPQAKYSQLPNPAIPTFDRRHSWGVRYGKQSAEVFSKANLALIPLDDGVVPATDEQIQTLKAK